LLGVLNIFSLLQLNVLVNRYTKALSASQI